LGYINNYGYFNQCDFIHGNKKMTLKNILHAYVYGSMGIITLAVIQLGIWYYFPEHIISVENPQKVSMDKQVYTAGEQFTYSFDYCKKKNVESKIQRFFVDGTRIPFNDTVSTLELGCHRANISVLSIPGNASTGTYHIVIQATYKVNPVREYVMELRTVDFQVIGKDEQLIKHEAQDQKDFQQLKDQVNNVK
jgi:hypothetical protein